MGIECKIEAASCNARSVIILPVALIIYDIIAGMRLRDQKTFFNKLLKILQECDSLGIELDAEWVKDKTFDRASLMLAGISAMLPLLLKEIEMEISITAEEDRMHKELGHIMDEEQNKFNRLPTELKAPDEEEDDEGDFENGL